MKILYHAGCDDGFGAAYAIWLKHQDQAEYIPVQHGEPFPEVSLGEAVYVVDFSYPREILQEAAKQCKLVVLDHHKTAMEDLADLPFAHFNMQKSGAVLAWEYFHPDQPVPLFLEYVQDYDLWTKTLPNTEENKSWRRSFPRTFSTWQELASIVSRDNSWQAAGEAILRSEQIHVQRRVAQAFEVTIDSYVVLAVNETQYHSDVAGELAKDTRYPFGACFSVQDDGLKVWSLRSNRDLGDFDVSAVAKLRGGGGHRNAAGFKESVECPILLSKSS
ncbi:phosphoesterase [SAR202 cluster bacterium AD-802-E10_MRT_200m]|nr:phosphoesterase [SAR202 cluster bacterium AD-802-E10_MRT_200m]